MVQPVLFETWARQPSNPDLNTWYPSLPVVSGAMPYLAAANEMQAELHKYYYQARAEMGNCALAPVGDTFQALGFGTNLYQSDLYHESNEGGLIVGMLLYEQIYKTKLASVPYATMNEVISGGLANYGVNSASDWTSLVATVDTETAAVPEPASLGLLAVGTMALLRRRRA
jgi:hypothetical protein